MKKFATIFLLALSFLALSLFVSPTVDAERPVPPNDRAKGLIYDGLEVSKNGECKGAFKVKVNGAKAGEEPQCSHGPDPFPQGFAFAKPSNPTPTPTQPSGPGVVMCDGDGVSGKRVQVLYVRAATTPSKYSTYLASFQQWAAEADAHFNNSAVKTGGSRRIRFVHDAGCKPVVTEVILSSDWAMESFGNMLSELSAQGYTSRSRKYMIFADSTRYCGIGSVVADDSTGTRNKSNSGPHYGRVDFNCWGGAVAAHELMHTLGGVQLSAPNTDGNWHCNDGYDLMCDYSGHNIQLLCSGTPGQSPFDCGNNDYFHSNPPANSYLATHWNPASNQFLINPVPTSRK